VGRESKQQCGGEEGTLQGARSLEQAVDRKWAYLGLLVHSRGCYISNERGFVNFDSIFEKSVVFPLNKSKFWSTITQVLPTSAAKKASDRWTKTTTTTTTTTRCTTTLDGL
jgi:hypothetical protein